MWLCKRSSFVALLSPPVREYLSSLQNSAEHRLPPVGFPYFLMGSFLLCLLWLDFVLVLLTAFMTQPCRRVSTPLFLVTINSLRPKSSVHSYRCLWCPARAWEPPNSQWFCAELLVASRKGEGAGGEGREKVLSYQSRTSGRREREGLSFSSQGCFLKDTCPLTSSVNKIPKKERRAKTLGRGSRARFEGQRGGNSPRKAERPKGGRTLHVRCVSAPSWELCDIIPLDARSLKTAIVLASSSSPPGLMV